MSDAALVQELRVAVDPDFNGLIAKAFLFGVYTLLLCQSLWKLLRKGNKVIYSSALLLLWVIVAAGFASDWIVIRGEFVVNNDSPMDIFLGREGDAAQNILADTALVMLIFVSDAILIWRCHMLWHNGYILLVLIILLLVSTGLTIADILVFSDAINVLLKSSGTFATFLTTVSATSLVVLKIVVVTRQSPTRHSYAKIIEIVVESAVPLSVVLLGLAILDLDSYFHHFKLSTTRGKILSQVFNYLAYCQGPVTGIAPTLIAFRVAEEPSMNVVHSTNRTGPLSRLTFNRSARGPNVNIQTIDGQFSTAYEGEYGYRLQAPTDIEMVQVHVMHEREK